MKCEVCGGGLSPDLLDLGMHPLCDDLIPFGSPDICKEYPIKIAFCTNCVTAHQLCQVKKEILFPKRYHYRARMTPSVLSFMQGLADDVEKFLPSLSGMTVLDIGCNDGSMLSKFRDKGCNTLGVDPTDAASDAKECGHLVLQDFFNHEVASRIVAMGIRPDIITFTNVFAHIEDLQALIAALKVVAHPDTLFIIENHYMGSILSACQFDTFYHEHPRTYSATSFRYIASSLDRNLLGIQFPRRYAGNIRAWIGPKALESHKSLELQSIPNESSFYDNFCIMSDQVDNWVAETKAQLDLLFAKYGRLPAKAFPGRASILLRLLGLDYTEISAIYEIKGSIKTGHYAPGTRIPILPESDLYSSGYSGPIINLAWHIANEVTANLRGNGFSGEIIQIKV